MKITVALMQYVVITFKPFQFFIYLYVCSEAVVKAKSLILIFNAGNY